MAQPKVGEVTMSGRTLRSLMVGLGTTAGAAVVALTAITNSAIAYGDVPPDPADPTIGLVMGGSGIPLPEYDVPGYVQAADTLYIHPNFPDTTYPAPYANGLLTPEYPAIAVPFNVNYPDATTGPLAGFPALNTSVGQGMLALENAIATNMAAGDTSTVFGWSQSATISSLVMQQLDPTGPPMPNDGLQFVLIGDPNAPNGGLAERFDGLNLPSLGISYDGATPSDSFPTDIYTIEYDGYADFPQYPINFLADLNADLGLVDIHSLYLNGGVDGSGPTAEQIANAVLLPGSALDGTADSLTNYYMIDETAPLVSLLPTQLQELLGPDLTYLINLGYGDGGLGYSDTPANIPTPFGLFPDVSVSTVLSTLVTDTEQGFQDLMSGTDPYASAALEPATSLATAAIPAALPTITDIINGISGAASALSGFVLQTADLGYAFVFDLPAYDATLFLNNLSDPLDAIGLPLAADTGLLTQLGGVEFELADLAITTAMNDITPLIP
jgi:hypothetical protein